MKEVPIPLVGGSYSDMTRPFSVQDTVNYLPVFAEKAGTRSPTMLRTVPGMQEYAFAGSRHRGGYVAEGKLFFVSGTGLYQLMPTGSVSWLGVIPGTGRVSFSHNQITNGNQVLIVNGSSGYIWNTVTSTLVRITDAGYPGAIVADFISQRFVQIEPQRRYFFNSALVDGLSYNALDTYEGEASPDPMVSLIVTHSEVVVFSEGTTEFFDYTGTTNALFENKQIVVERGCGARFSPCNLDNSVFFIGDDGRGYRLNGYTPERITTGPIEQAWALCDLSKAFAFTWEDRSHSVWYVTFPDGYTWGYDVSTREFHRRQSYGMNRWRLAWLVKWRGDYYGGEYNTGRIFRLDWNYLLEGCAPIISERITGVGHDNQNIMTVHELECVFDTGQEVTVCAPVFPLAFDMNQTRADGVIFGGSLPDMAVGDVVDFHYRTIGGVSPVSIELSSGMLPAGLIMDALGHVTGTLTTAEHNNSWSVVAQDAEGTSVALVEEQYVMDMLGDPPDGGTSAPYSFTLTGSEGTAPYAFATSSGALPTGLTLATDGEISGTPSVEDDFAFDVTMTDANGVAQTKSYTITIAAFFISLGPVAWWKLSEGSGTVLIEQIAGRNGVHSASFGGSSVAVYTPAITTNSTYSLTCNGSGGQAAANSVFDVGNTTAWSVCVSFKFTGSNPTGYNKNIFLNANSVTLGHLNWQISITPAMLLQGLFSVSGGAESVTYATPIVVGAVHRTWLVRDGLFLYLYLDGSLVATQAIPAATAFYSGVEGVYFGNGYFVFNPNQAYAGPVSDAAIFDKTISASDIAADATYFAAVP